MIKKVILLNDTSYENHHGCNIVIKNIEKNLKLRDIELLLTIPIGKRWIEDEEFKKYLPKVDCILINAEGTIHDNSIYAQSLLEIVNYTDKPCVLMNMTYQNNSKYFSELVSKFKQVYVRENFSKIELEQDGINSMVVPDMTMFYFDDSYLSNNSNKNIYITDSHDIKLSERLFNFKNIPLIKFLPLISPFVKYSNFKSFMKVIKFNFFYFLGIFISKIIPIKYGYKRFTYVKIEKDFLQSLKDMDFMISARFHAICLSLHFSKPFIAISSNTFKIESLLNDIGINSNRIVKIEELMKMNNIDKEYLTLSQNEKNNIKDYLNNANKKISFMFDEIKNIT